MSDKKESKKKQPSKEKCILKPEKVRLGMEVNTIHVHVHVNDQSQCQI
jgi:hypothetical protein